MLSTVAVILLVLGLLVLVTGTTIKGFTHVLLLVVGLSMVLANFISGGRLVNRELLNEKNKLNP
jgi:hypothetical protein